MPEMPFVKASSVTNLADARYFASYNVAVMGFCFDPRSDNFINPHTMQEISDWIEGPQFAGEFDNLSVAAIIDMIQTLHIQFAQLKLQSLTAAHQAIDMIARIFEITVASEHDIQKAEKQLPHWYRAGDYVLIDMKSITEDMLWKTAFSDLVLQLCSRYPVIIDYRFSAANLQSIIERFHPSGISLRGNVAIGYGIKSFEMLDNLFDILYDKF